MRRSVFHAAHAFTYPARHLRGQGRGEKKALCVAIRLFYSYSYSYSYSCSPCPPISPTTMPHFLTGSTIATTTAATATASTQTEILGVDPSSIHFSPSSSSSCHPFDQPTLKITCPSTHSTLLRAADLLRRQHLPVAFPTETVYGIGADATDSNAVSRIFRAKNRPSDNPLIVHISSLQQLRRLLCSNSEAAEIIPHAYMPLISKFWPGPLTILLPLSMHSRSLLAPVVTAGQQTFAVRLPSHSVALALAHLADTPIAAPSANISGRPSPTTAAHVYADLQGRVPMILDGGPADIGLESTVVSGLCDPPRILRPGGVSLEMIRSLGGVWSRCVAGSDDGASNAHKPSTHEGNEPPPLIVPGMKYKHYSPKATVILYEPGASQPTIQTISSVTPGGEEGVGKVGILRTKTWPSGWQQKAQAEYIRSSSNGTTAPTLTTTPITTSSAHTHPLKLIDVEELHLGYTGTEISRTLFAALRELDDLGVRTIHVEGIMEEDEGLAVMNRLRKAASLVVR